MSSDEEGLHYSILNPEPRTIALITFMDMRSSEKTIPMGLCVCGALWPCPDSEMARLAGE